MIAVCWGSYDGFNFAGWRGGCEWVAHLGEVVEELFGHVEQEPVLAESRREARVNLEYLVD